MIFNDFLGQKLSGKVFKGSMRIKKCPKKWKKSKRGVGAGEGSAQKIKKSKIRNLDFLIRGGGAFIFIFSQM